MGNGEWGMGNGDTSFAQFELECSFGRKGMGNGDTSFAQFESECSGELGWARRISTQWIWGWVSAGAATQSWKKSSIGETIL